MGSVKIAVICEYATVQHFKSEKYELQFFNFDNQRERKKKRIYAVFEITKVGDKDILLSLSDKSIGILLLDDDKNVLFSAQFS